MRMYCHLAKVAGAAVVGAAASCKFPLSTVGKKSIV